MGNSLTPGFFHLPDYLEWLEELALSGLSYEIRKEGVIISQNGQTFLMQTPPILQHDLQYYPGQILERAELAQPVLILLMQAGHAAIAVAATDQILKSKIISKYMVRKSQGKAQYSYLEQKGKSRLGSRIRLQQSKEFFDEINEYLESWQDSFDIQTIFASCSPRLKGAWYSHAKGPPIEKQDPRWRKIGRSINKPNQQELKQVHHFLSRARLVPWTQESHDEN